MIESWWEAHALEVIASGVVLGLGAAWWLCASLSDAWRERKQKKRDGLL